MLRECASLSYLPLEFARLFGGQWCEAAARNRASGLERPGPESLRGLLLTAGLWASFLTSLCLAGINAC